MYLLTYLLTYTSLSLTFPMYCTLLAHTGNANCHIFNCCRWGRVYCLQRHCRLPACYSKHFSFSNSFCHTVFYLTFSSLCETL